MVRASMLALTLVALPASAFLEKWVDKQIAKDMEEGRQNSVKALSSKNPQERIDAVRYFSGLKDKDSIGHVTRALSDPDARVRETAASGLWSIEKDAEPARAQLTAALDDPDPNVVARAAGALQALGVKEKDLVAPRQRVLNSREASDSSRFLVSRNLIGEEPAIRLLYPMLTYLEVNARGNTGSATDPRRDNVELARDALERLVKKTQDRSLIEPLVTEMQKERETQAILLRTLGFFKPKPDRWAETLVALLDSKQPRVPYAALGEMHDLTQERDVRVWAPRAGDLLRHPDSSMRSQAVWALAGAGGLAASETDKVVAALGDSETSVRKGAARALGEMGESKQAVPAAAKTRVATAARPALTAAMERDPDKDVRSEAKYALEKLVPAGGALAVAPPEATAVASTEAAGLAVLRARKIAFEPSMFYRSLGEQDVTVARAFLDAGMSPTDPLFDQGPPIRIMFFSNGVCSEKERPTKPATKELVKLLLDRGADVNGSDRHGNTALQGAASKGCDREVMRMLIKAGAKVNAANASGLTAFEFGLDSGHDGLEELIAAGYRLPAAKVKDYNDAYKKNPASVAMIRKAAAKK
jgi:HEAT repeat protein